MAATVTATGTTGPGFVLTAVVYTFVKRFTFNTETNILHLTLSTGQPFDIAIPAATTITATKSGSTYTLTVS